MRVLAALLLALLPGAGAAPVPLSLPPQEADLTIRFSHLDARVSRPHLVGAWTFDEGAGYSFADGSGHGHRAYVTGTRRNTSDSGLTSALHRSGRRGGALHLNGTSWAEVGDAPDLAGVLGVTAWVRPESAGSERVILDKARGYRLGVGQGGRLRFTVQNAGGSARTVESGPGTLTPGGWSHVAATVDPGRGLLRLYVNGQPAGEARGTPFVPARTTTHVQLGAGGGEDGFVGLIDEVTLHDRTLSPQEVAGLYAVGLPRPYAQTRATVDPARRVWSRPVGNDPAPHPVEPDTLLSLRFNGNLGTDGGAGPLSGTATFVPGQFGAAADIGGELTYASPLTGTAGTFEAWRLPDAGAERTIFRALGTDGSLALMERDGRLTASLRRGDDVLATVTAPAPRGESPTHLALSWRGGGQLALFVNGSEVGRASLPAALPTFSDRVQFGGVLDDVRLSRLPRGWGQVMPRGQARTVSAALDLLDRANHEPGEALHLWQPSGGAWGYGVKPWEDGGSRTGADPAERGALRQGSVSGLATLFHPDAVGEAQSIEAGVSFEDVRDGWAGVFVGASGPGTPQGGLSFTLNPARNEVRLAVHDGGRVKRAKTLPHDFKLAPRRTSTLTLTSNGDGVLRGFVDGHNVISMRVGAEERRRGHAGLLTQDTPALFDDVGFRALTPAAAASRQLQTRLFSDLPGAELNPKTQEYSALRWQKRPGLLPWAERTKNPEPPGGLFGPDDGVPRPHPPAAWRSEDSANSELLEVDGTVYYVMRGNPRIGETHGPAVMGMLAQPVQDFDALHFADLGRGAGPDAGALLRGHPDPAPAEMRDDGPRAERFQVNDQNAVLVGGKIVVFMREFRNRVGGSPWYRRLVYGVFDPGRRRWETPEPRYVGWSRMNPADPAGTLEGLDATPEVVALRDPDTDAPAVFLFHHATSGARQGAVSGLRLQDGGFVLDGRYPEKTVYAEEFGGPVYGEHVLFDNGLYLLNYNASSIHTISGDWPDRLHLAAGLSPYVPFVNSEGNLDDTRPYFARGGELDPDNAAIWNGAMLKHRGRYYLYYEYFHATDDVNAPYQNYDDVNAGSRVGFATGN